MSVIHTKRNMVCALEPLEQDSWVMTTLSCGGECHRLSILPIDQYDAVVDWAVGMADQFELPIQIVPIDADDFVQLSGERLERAFASLTDQERRELRQCMVNSMTEVVRDCPDPDVRSGAFDVLAKLGAVDGIERRGG